LVAAKVPHSSVGVSPGIQKILYYTVEIPKTLHKKH